MSNTRLLITCTLCNAEYDDTYVEWCECESVASSPICPTCWFCCCDASLSVVGVRPQPYLAPMPPL
jgi:hypothetical protein